MPDPLTDTEKAYFDTIKQVAQSPRRDDLKLFRMTLDVGAAPDGLEQREVAVVVQRVIDDQAATKGFQPLAILVDDETASRLRSPTGEAPEKINPDGLEGAA